MPDVIALAVQYRNELLLQDAKALGRLARAYHSTFRRLADQLNLLMEATETASISHRKQRLYSLLEQMAEQLRDLQGLTATEINELANISIRLGTNHASGLMAAVAGDERLAIVFNRLNPEVIKSLLGFLDPAGPLYERLGKLAEVSAKRISEDLIEGVVAGWNPVKIAEVFRKDWGRSLTDAMRMTRTTQLYSYREATRANYIANSDVVEGWIWCCDLSSETCAACLAMDGTFHTNDETLDDHYNGRCSMLPVVKGFDRPIDEGRGQSWFDEQSTQTKQDILGKSKYEALEAGKFQFADLPGTRMDNVYGEMRMERSLADLVGEEE